jgi:CelD/BcsL family acetyltransferase involved in cellulose biosynthesis
MKSLQVRVYETLDKIETLRPQWEQLLCEFRGATTFSSWEWLAPWWRAFGQGQQLLMLAFLDESSRLVGLAPLCVEKRKVAPLIHLQVVRFWGDGSGDSDNLDFPVRAGYEDQVTQTLVHYLSSESKLWDYCEFNTMPRDSAVGRCLERQLRLARCAMYRSESAASVVSIGETWESYLAQLSAKERGKVSNRANRLKKRYRVRYYKCETEAEVPGCLETLYNLHQKRWQSVGEPGSFTAVARRQFYGELAVSLVRRGCLEFWFLDLDGAPVATQFGFRFGDTVFSLQEGYDPAYSPDSVGYVLRAHAIRELISGGVRRYHFLGGEGPSKSRWGAQATNYVNIHFARSFNRGSLYLRLINGARAAKESLRRYLPQSVWQGLHRLNVALSGVKRHV